MLLRGFSCGAISGIVSLRDFSAEQFHALCCCKIFLRSVSRIVSLQDFSCGVVSRVVSLRDFFLRSNLIRCVVERLFVRSVSRSVSLRDFSCVASHALCRCKIYLRSSLTCCVVARFFAEWSYDFYRCETFRA